jgi:hypothetical protein
MLWLKAEERGPETPVASGTLYCVVYAAAALLQAVVLRPHLHLSISLATSIISSKREQHWIRSVLLYKLGYLGLCYRHQIPTAGSRISSCARYRAHNRHEYQHRNTLKLPAICLQFAYIFAAYPYDDFVGRCSIWY